MSKELVINATSHERRVAILEEGQLVEIYIEREKEFALVGSIYKGKVTRVLPGMQSAFVDIGLDGDAFLYVSDVFENLEGYDHGHEDHGQGHGDRGHSHEYAPAPAEGGEHIVLPGESLGRTQESAPAVSEHADPEDHEIRSHVEEVHAASEDVQPGVAENMEQFEDERQPDSNESAPKNFGPQYNPTQYNPAPRFNNRSNQGNGGRGDFHRGDRGNDRGGDRGGRGRWGRRGGGGGRRRGGRPGGPGGRNLPPSKYASPQGGDRESRSNYENRGDRGGYDRRGPRRDFSNNRPEGGRYGQPGTPSSSGPAEEEFLLPGESLAKFRNRPAASAPVAPVEEQISGEPHTELPEDAQPRGSTLLPGAASAPRRSRGSLPSWLLAGGGAESTEVAGEQAEALEAEEADLDAEEIEELEEAQAVADEAENGVELSDEERTTLSSSLIDAKQDEVREVVSADSAAGGAVFEEDELEDEEELSEAEEVDEEEDEDHEPAVQEIVSAPQAVAEAAADAAHENALHIAALGDHVELEHHEPTHEYHEEDHEEHDEHHDHEHEHEHESEPAGVSAAGVGLEDDSILLPGETRAPHTGPREEFAPRDSARIGGGGRSRFQRPFRGGRDRGGRGDRGGRPDRRGGRGRFDRRGGGHGHHSGQRFRGHSGPPRRPQL